MKGLVKFDTGDYGTEIWLVDNPDETREAFDKAAETWEPTGDEESPLDAADRVSKGCVVIAAHWGNHLPAEADDIWLAQRLTETREKDREELESEIRHFWNR